MYQFRDDLAKLRREATHDAGFLAKTSMPSLP